MYCKLVQSFNFHSHSFCRYSYLYVSFVALADMWFVTLADMWFVTLAFILAVILFITLAVMLYVALGGKPLLRSSLYPLGC